MQGELFHDRDQKKRLDRLFFGLFPDPHTAGRIDQAAQRFQRDRHIGNKLQQIERQHISILHVGDYRRLREKFVFAARRAAAGILLPTFDVLLEAIGSFEGRPSVHGALPHRPLVMQARGDGLFALFDCLGCAMQQNGLRPHKHFMPHLTVSYGPQMIAFQAITPIHFVAGELVLIHSEVGLTRYHVLGHWPLRGRS